MNERIGNNKVYLLAKEAGLIEFEKFDWNPELQSPTQDSVVKAHKFAQLIVKECAKVLTQHGAYFSGDGEPYHYAASLIEEHFGVEE